MAAATPSPSTSSASPSSSETAVAVPWERVERFVGQLAHDIRNGLNALELQLTFLGEISTDPEAVEEVKRLRATLLDITRQLQAVKLATSSVGPHVMIYPAADFFEDLRERVERRHPDAAAKISWTVTLNPDDTLMIDPDLTINGLLELFTNTFRFAGEGTRCLATGQPAGISFVLEETPVAPPAVSPDRWGREPLLSSHRGAYGLGLFRTRRILENQGGMLDAVYLPDENLLRTTVTLPRPAGSPA